MDRATGLLLERSGIIMADAESGQVTHMPNVPYASPRPEVESVMPQPQSELQEPLRIEHQATGY